MEDCVGNQGRDDVQNEDVFVETTSWHSFERNNFLKNSAESCEDIASYHERFIQ